MNRPEISSLLAAANAAANAAINEGRRNSHREAELNSARIEVVADKLALCSQFFGQPDDARLFFQLCLSLARGIDYGVANNEVPEKASKLPPILKQVCRRKNEFFLQAAIMVLMISVKNACKMGWFTANDREELLTLANEVGSCFSTLGELNGEASILPTVSSIMSRFYPRFKIGQVIASLEVKPGYGTYLLDFHISKNVPYSPEEKIRLFVAMKDNIDTSSCIISPQKVNILLNGRPVERRTNIFMDPGPQFPTVVNHLLKYGTNLLQAVGHFNGHYIMLIAFMSIVPPSSLPVPEDYVQPDTALLCSELDSEIIEGPSRISLNCPITYRRIKTPVKGQLCKHYQCFDLSNYVELNSKRPSWRCPHCNQSVCFTDLRVDQRMAKVLLEVGENVSEVIISADGSWTAASSSNNKTSADEQEQHQHPDSSGADASCKIYDLTEEDDEMETGERFELLDTKPVIHHNVQNQQAPANSTLSPATRSTNGSQYSSALVAHALSGTLVGDSGSANSNITNSNIRSEAQVGSGVSRFPTGSSGISPVLTDSVSPQFNQLAHNFQGPSYATNSTPLGQFLVPNGLQLSDLRYPQSVTCNDNTGPRMIPRNVGRAPSAIQALPIQMPSLHQQHSRPSVSMPATNRSSVPLQAPLTSHAHVSSSLGNVIDRQWQSLANPSNVSNMPPLSLQNRSAPRVASPSTPNQSVNVRMPQMPQTLSQPPHLRSSQVPHNHVQQGVSHGGVSNSPSTVERIQLLAQRHPAQMRQLSQTTPPQTQAMRMASASLPLNTGVMPPQAVSRTENLIDLQSEQNWRPAGRMRGSLTGQAYSAALSQVFGNATQPSQAPVPRPSLPAAPLSPHLQALASRMHSQVPQVLNRTTNASNVTGAPGTQPEGPRGI